MVKRARLVWGLSPHRGRLQRHRGSEPVIAEVKRRRTERESVVPTLQQHHNHQPPPEPAAEPAEPAAEPKPKPADDAWWAEELLPFDLYRCLGLSRVASGRAAGEIKGGGSRLRCAFHRHSLKYHPEHWVPSGVDAADDAQAREARLAVLAFRRVCLAFAVLRDPARKAIYDAHGFATLRRAEDFCETNLFDADPFETFEHFFSGEDAGDREYLLLSAVDGGVFSEDEEDHALEEGDRNGALDEEEEEEEEEEDGGTAMLLAAAAAEKSARVHRWNGEGAAATDSAAAPLPIPPVALARVSSVSMLGPAPPPAAGMEFGDVWKRTCLSISRRSKSTPS